MRSRTMHTKNEKLPPLAHWVAATLGQVISRTPIRPATVQSKRTEKETLELSRVTLFEGLAEASRLETLRCIGSRRFRRHKSEPERKHDTRKLSTQALACRDEAKQPTNDRAAKEHNRRYDS